MQEFHVSAEQLKGVYEKLRCEPLRMDWIDVEGRMCSPFVAILILKKKIPARKLADLFHEKDFEFCCKQIAIELKVHIAYISGFELGFALMSSADIKGLGLPEFLISGEDFTAGHLDGQNIAKML